MNNRDALRQPPPPHTHTLLADILSLITRILTGHSDSDVTFRCQLNSFNIRKQILAMCYGKETE